MTPRPFREAAQRFLIWRYGTNVAWRTTFAEIAQVTGIDVLRVGKICRKYGYTLERESHQPPHMMPVDNYMALSSANIRGRY